MTASSSIVFALAAKGQYRKRRRRKRQKERGNGQQQQQWEAVNEVYVIGDDDAML